jgi:NADH-quinone oxidoreductase subunit C
MPGYSSSESLPPALTKVLSDLLGPDLISLTEKCPDEFLAHVYPASIVRVLTILRDHPLCTFHQLVDITAIDYLNQSTRFEVLYNLLSHKRNQRLIIKVSINEETPLNSSTSVFECANWYEREVWDLFGIPFSDHPDLRRLLTDYNFGGHPLLKDFPLSGYSQVRFEADQHRVIQEPVHLSQPYRNFDFLSPWEGPSPAACQQVKDG